MGDEHTLPRHQRIALAMRGYRPGDFARMEEERREHEAILAPLRAEAERIRAGFVAAFANLVPPAARPAKPTRKGQGG
jgi:hypothetical protein